MSNQPGFDQPIVTPITLASTFTMKEPSTDQGHQYSRVSNPTRNQLEQELAELEQAQHAFVFSSGSAAMATVLQLSAISPRLICHHQLYEGTRRILKKVAATFDLKITMTDMTKTDQLQQELKKGAAAIWCETISNPLLDVLDIKQLSQLAHQFGSLVVVDNSLANPINRQPLKLGADLVIESLSKSINGHSDVIGGMVATNQPKLAKEIKFMQHTFGAILSPFDSYLVLRGLKTFELRCQAQAKSATTIKQFLSNQAKIKQVYFPGFGSMISFKLKDKLNSEKFINSLNLIKIAHSFGGVETVIQQPATMMSLDQNSAKMIKSNLFRLSVGLENTELLINDLSQAFKSLIK